MSPDAIVDVEGSMGNRIALAAAVARGVEKLRRADEASGLQSPTHAHLCCNAKRPQDLRV